LDFKRTQEPDTPSVSALATQAVRFEDKENDKLRMRNIPSGVRITLWPELLLQRSSAEGLTDPMPYGGDFGELLLVKYRYRYTESADVPGGAYMDGHPNVAPNAGEDVRRTLLPPPLHREGEKVQPSWLQRFLRDPK